MPSGFLSVRVFTSTAQLPICNASVIVTENTPNGVRLHATRVTDDSGQITPIKITTPERNESLSPGTLVPFTKVDIIVEHPHYEREMIENAQIFAGILTQQNVELFPLSERPDSFNMTNVVDTTAQEL